MFTGVFILEGVPAGYSQKDWIRKIYPTLSDDEKPLECIQEAGDILYLVSYLSDCNKKIHIDSKEFVVWALLLHLAFARKCSNTHTHPQAHVRTHARTHTYTRVRSNRCPNYQVPVILS